MKKNEFFRRIAAGMAAVVLLVAAFQIPAAADNEEYGVDAYRYVRIINDNFAYRINNKEITGDQSQIQGMRDWIIQKMAEFGYTPKYYQGAIENHDFTSLSFTKPGNSEKRIVIGAHYDCAETLGAEDNGTGVGMVLELAKRFQDTPTNLTLEFCFWDGEEFRGMAGSYLYLEQVPDRENIFLYMNLDCLGAGDNMYVYGGDYDEGGVLQRSWGYNMAMTLSQELHIDLHDMPSGIDRYVPPTRTTASDQFYFNERGIPYVYFEANAWLTSEGVQGNPEKPYNYNSTLPCFADTNGRIIHTKYDDLDTLESLIPGRIQAHLTDFSKVISEMVRRMDTNSPVTFKDYVRYSPPVSPEPETTETSASEEETDVTETVEENTEESSADISEETAGTIDDDKTAESQTTAENEQEPVGPVQPEGDVLKKAAKEGIFIGLAWGTVGLMGLVFVFSIYKIIYWAKKKDE